MTEPTFPPELVQRCGERVWELHLTGNYVTATEIAEAVLLAAGHDKLVEALVKARAVVFVTNLSKLVDCEALLLEIDAALTAAAPLARVEAD